MAVDELKVEMAAMKTELEGLKISLQWQETQKTSMETKMKELVKIKEELEELKDNTKKQKNDDGFDMTSRRSFQSIKTYGGKADEFEDWRFVMKIFLGSEPGFVDIVSRIDMLEDVPTKEIMEKVYAELNVEYANTGRKLDWEWMNRQLYQILCLKLTGTALSLVKNLMGSTGLNGFIGWWKVGHEATGMTSHRMQGLAGKVYAPKRCRKLNEVSAAIEEWEIAVNKFETTERTKLTDQTRMYGLRQLVPEDIEKDIIRSHSLTTYPEVKKYITEQVSIRRDLKAATGPVPMELDLAKKLLSSMEGQESHEGECGGEHAHGHDHGHCDGGCDDRQQGEEEEDGNGVLLKLVNMIKGKGKGKGGGGKGQGKFEGNCSYCGVYGHRLNQCWKKDKDMAEARGKGKGKGGKDGGGKGDNGKGGSWGGYGGKGWGNGGKGGGWYGNAWQDKGKGKGAYSLGWWDMPGVSVPKDAANQGGSWTLNLSKKTVLPPGGIMMPPGLSRQDVSTTGSWEILRPEDVKEEESVEVNEYEENFPDAKTEKMKHTGKMPKMPNYSKGKMRRMDLSLFQKRPVQEPVSHGSKELNKFIGPKPDAQGWVRIKGVMDSGASESVAPPSMCPHYPVQESPGSKVGQCYLSASDDTIPNLGEQVLDVVTHGGSESTAKYQMAEVTRPLNSVSEICDGGGEYGQYVIFGKYGGAIMNLETGMATHFEREDGVYCLDLWVKPRPGFQRQG